MTFWGPIWNPGSTAKAVAWHWSVELSCQGHVRVHCQGALSSLLRDVAVYFLI